MSLSFELSYEIHEILQVQFLHCEKKFRQAASHLAMQMDSLARFNISRMTTTSASRSLHDPPSSLRPHRLPTPSLSPARSSRMRRSDLSSMKRSDPIHLARRFDATHRRPCATIHGPPLPRKIVPTLLVAKHFATSICEHPFPQIFPGNLDLSIKPPSSTARRIPVSARIIATRSIVDVRAITRSVFECIADVRSACCAERHHHRGSLRQRLAPSGDLTGRIVCPWESFTFAIWKIFQEIRPSMSFPDLSDPQDTFSTSVFPRHDHHAPPTCLALLSANGWLSSLMRGIAGVSS